MSALIDNTDTPRRASDNPMEFPQKAATVAYVGALIVLSGGYGAPGTTATGLVAVGRCRQLSDNGAGANGDVTVRVESGTFRWGNADSITRADVGKTAWIVDDNNVSKASTGKSPAGVIVGVDSAGVWVKTSPELSRALLDAANAMAGAVPAASIQYVHGLSLVAGDVTCSTLTITASSTIIPLREVPDTTVAHWGALTITSPTPGAPGSFHIHSASSTDVSVVGAIVIN